MVSKVLKWIKEDSNYYSTNFLESKFSFISTTSFENDLKRGLETFSKIEIFVCEILKS